LSYAIGPTLRRIAGEVVLAGAAVAVLVVAAFALVLVRRRAPPPPPVATPTPPPAPAAVARTARDEVEDALRAYRSVPANGSLVRLRGALFAAAGAPPGATLRDALAATRDDRLRAALAAAERTAFGPAYVRDASSAELIDAAQAWLR